MSCCSMTGYGKAVSTIKKGTVSVSIRSTNNRFLDLKTHISEPLSELLPTVEDIIKKKLHRGSVYTTVTFIRSSDSAPASSINRTAALHYMNMLADLNKKHGQAGMTYSADSILALPGVVEEKQGSVSRALKTCCFDTTKKALEKLIKARSREGARLEKKIAARLKKIETTAARIGKKAPASVGKTMERLRDRIRKFSAQNNTELSDNDLARELVLYSDKNDISEELDRIESHIRQYRDTLSANGSKGRKLEFVLQELHREFNTVGAKTCDSWTGCRIVEVKTLIEALREQVQNIE